MMTQTSPQPSLKFPLWKYLNQPLFDSSYRAIVNPIQFWLCYRICYLERCLVSTYRPEEHMS